MTCDVCSKKIIMNKNTLADGKVICPSCFGCIPKDLRDFARVKWTLHDYQMYKRYCYDKQKDWKTIFAPTIKTSKIRFDIENDLYSCGNGYIYSARMINTYQLLFMPYQSIPIPIFNRLLGTSYITIESIVPKFSKRYVINKYAMANCYYDDDRKLHYGLSEELTLLNVAFKDLNNKMSRESARHNCYKDADYRSSGNGFNNSDSYNSNQKNRANSNISQNEPEGLKFAMNLFMVEDLSSITEKELKSTRNRLIKSFHPDNTNEQDKYAQKINDAYEILDKFIREQKRPSQIS